MNDNDEQQAVEDRGDVAAEIDTEAVEAPEATEATLDTPTTEKAPQSPPEREIHIPKERFDEVNSRWREDRQALLEERQARLDAEARLREVMTPKTPTFDPHAAEKEYLEAVNDGDKDKARELWTKIRDHERRLTTEQLTAQMRAELAQTTERLALATTAEALVEKYPFLDPQSADANPEAIKDVVEWRDYFIYAKKMTPAQALKQAASRIAPQYVKQSAPPSTGIDRTQAQRLTNAKAAAALPPNTAQAGIGERAARAEKLDATRMSEKEFEALSEADRAKLRGDTVI